MRTRLGRPPQPVARVRDVDEPLLDQRMLDEEVPRVAHAQEVPARRLVLGTGRLGRGPDGRRRRGRVAAVPALAGRLFRRSGLLAHALRPRAAGRRRGAEDVVLRHQALQRQLESLVVRRQRRRRRLDIGQLSLEVLDVPLLPRSERALAVTATLSSPILNPK
jgi:hypothetical protein